MCLADSHKNNNTLMESRDKRSMHNSRETGRDINPSHVFPLPLPPLEPFDLPIRHNGHSQNRSDPGVFPDNIDID